MAGLGNRQGAETLNHILGKSPDTTPAGVVWVSLHTGDPGEDGQTANEATGAGYARVSTVAVDWDVADDSTSPATTQNASVIQFPLATGDWSGAVDFTFFAIWDDASLSAEANYIATGPITTPKSVESGDQIEFANGVLTWTIN